MPSPFLRTSTTKGGYTLLELVLYFGISSVVLLATSITITIFFQARLKNQAISEVEQQGNQVLSRVTQMVRNAQTLIGPGIGTNGSSLSLDAYTMTNNPTTFDLANGALRLTEGANPTILLTNTRVVASELTIQNISRAGTPGIVRIQFTLRSVYPNEPATQQYAKIFTGSASIHHP